MTASDNKPVQTTQKSLLPGFQLFNASAFAVVSLLSIQAAVAQDQTADLALPEAPAPAVQPVETPAVQPVAPLPVVPQPVVIEPVVPNTTIVPTAIDRPAAEPATVDYGTVFIEPTAETAPELPATISQPGHAAADTTPADIPPSVEVISPFDYSTAEVDPTDYSVGATLPDVVVSERSSGCQFSVKPGSQVTNGACRQVERLASAITRGITPGRRLSAPINLPGGPVTGATTTASREFYNRAAEPVVKLQLGKKFVFPLTLPSPLTSLFGWRIHPIFGDNRFHTGSDLGAPLGTPVVATQAGRVSMADFAGGYGLMVVLRHSDDTLESRYAHLSRLLVQPGDWVEQGEVVGLVGSTGNSTGPHLHFELRQRTENGWVVLNPDSMLQQTLGTLVQALGNSVLAFADKSIEGTKGDVAEAKGLPFRPAQPHAN